MVSAHVLSIMAALAWRSLAGDPPLAPAWEAPVHPEPGRLVGHAGAVIDATLYLVGGIDDRNTRLNDRVLRFEPDAPAESRWRVGAAMPTHRSFPGVAATRGPGARLFVFGGACRGVEWMDAAECFDPAGNQWHTLPAMPTPRSRLVACEVDGVLYAIGGLGPGTDGSGENLGVVEAFDPRLGAWTRRTAMPTGRHGHAAVVLNGAIIVLGGSTGKDFTTTSVAERYDPRREAWDSLPSMAHARLFFGAAVVEGRIEVFGTHAREIRGESWQPGEAAWREDARTLQRGRFVTALIGERVVLIGGENADAEANPLRWLSW